ncbi:MAG: NAD(P)/FAD-dependent oxidoreductase [Candidatus Dormibacteraceae bacterium]
MATSRVVILGAGFGGLTLARSLKGAPVRVVLIDRNDFHLFSPLLYQVASSMLDPSDIAQPVRRLLRGVPNCDFMQADVEGVDLEGKRVRTNRGALPYDTLVVATGSATNFFGNRSVTDHSYPLKELSDAMALRNRILGQFEQAEWEPDPQARRKLLSVVVTGGGPTGVEFTGAVSELIDLVVRKDLKRIRREEIAVHLLEGGDRLLPAFDPKLSAAAFRSLEKKGVKIRLNALVEGVEGDQVSLRGGEQVTAGTLVWTAGVRGVIAPGGLPSNERASNQIPVTDRLQVEGHPEVFVIGDVGGHPDDLPMLSPVAMQGAKYVAQAIRAGGPRARFEYHDPGTMATIGRGSGVAQLGRLRFSGVLGWAMWLAVHLLKIMTFRARLFVLVKWAWDYTFIDRPIRIAVRAGAGPRDAPADQVLRAEEATPVEASPKPVR